MSGQLCPTATTKQQYTFGGHRVRRNHNIISYCDRYSTRDYSASGAVRFSREPLKPVAAIGKLLSFTAYYMHIILQRIHKMCIRHAFTTLHIICALANTNYKHLRATITYTWYSNDIMYNLETWTTFEWAKQTSCTRIKFFSPSGWWRGKKTNLLIV